MRFPSCSPAFYVQNKIKGLKEMSKQTQGDRPRHMKSGYSKELNVQNVSYLMEFSSCSEKRFYLIVFFENWYTLRFFQ